MSRPELSFTDAQNLFDTHLDTIRLIQFGEGGVKWPRFKFDEYLYYLDVLHTLPDDFEKMAEFQHEIYLKTRQKPSDCGRFSVGPAAADGSRRVMIIRSVRDQSACLSVQISLTPEENRKIDECVGHPLSKIAIQKMLLTKVVGFWDHSILKLKTPEGNTRYSLKAGKDNRVGAGGFSVVKDELAFAVFNPEGERVNLVSEPRRVIRAAVEEVNPVVQELNLYDAAASGQAPKKTKITDNEKRKGEVKCTPRNTVYTVQTKSVSLYDWIKLNNPYLDLPTPFALSALPASTPDEVRKLFQCAIGLTQAVRLLHKKGVVHRDLKPGNTLLEVKKTTADEERYYLKLADFGLAADCRGLADGIDAIPVRHAGTPFYFHDFNAAPHLSYHVIDTIALLKTFFMDENTVIFARSVKRFLTFMDPIVSNADRKKIVIDDGHCCLFPRALVDRRPALSILLRSVSQGISAPYDIDTILCALLLEAHGLLDTFLQGGRIVIPSELKDVLLAQFDREPDVNPLDEEAFHTSFVSRYVACPIVERMTEGEVSAVRAQGIFAVAKSPTTVDVVFDLSSSDSLGSSRFSDRETLSEVDSIEIYPLNGVAPW